MGDCLCICDGDNAVLASLVLEDPASLATGYTALSLPSADPTKGPFNLVYNQSTVNEGQRDPIIFFGYNVGPQGGGRAHAGDNQGAMFLSIEGDWKPAGGQEMTEFHVESIDAAGVLHRLFSFASVNATGYVSGHITANQFVFYDKNNNTPLLSLNSGAVGNPTAGQVVLNKGNFYFGQFGSQWLAMNFVGSAYLPLIGLDPYRTRGDNVLALGWPVLNAQETDAYLSGRLAILNKNPAHVPHTVQAKTGQTARLSEWLGPQPPTGPAPLLASIDAAGSLDATGYTLAGVPVTLGPPDSGGTGFRILRIPN